MSKEYKMPDCEKCGGMPECNNTCLEKTKAEAFKTGYDFAIQSLAEITDEGMLLTAHEFNKVAADNKLTLNPGKVILAVVIARAQLSKVLSVVRAKVEKQQNPYPHWILLPHSSPENPEWLAWERCRQDTLKLLGGK